ncbi:MAG: class I SAM-dependent methyltransferase [Alphaproteobacteria bacterium]|nr:MAG: class I SAM-dependent methyltransferase [Alphaproteobacteria bacterium]
MSTAAERRQEIAEDKFQFPHAMLPGTTADEYARQEFVKSFKLHLATRVAPGNKLAYERRALPKFQKEKGRAPKDRHEVRKAMEGDGFYQMWSALQRASQELMWKSCQLPVERQLPRLVEAARSAPSHYATLTLDPSLEIPAYHRAVDIHCQPGGYHSEFVEGDVASGAIYDRAVYIYAMGRMGPFNDDMGASLIAYLKRKLPDFKPRRILDMGCTVGHSTVPYADAFPEAEIHAIDVAAPVLRYAHARAESLKKRIHFSQQNAEHTNFADGYFDLIVSHILIHETSGKAFRNIMKECRRLLAPGGWVVHAETPPYKDMAAFDAFMLDWDTRNNNEPFWGGSHEIDPVAIAKECGFRPDSVFEAMAPSAFEAAEADRTHVFQGGDFAGGGMWYLYGMQR